MLPQDDNDEQEELKVDPLLNDEPHKRSMLPPQSKEKASTAYFSFDFVKSEFIDGCQVIDKEYHRRHMELRRN